MKVKKYIASTMAEALTQIKQELGSDAVILNSKQIKVGGVLGLFKQNKLEVIAALDENPLPRKPEVQAPIGEQKKQPRKEKTYERQDSQQDVLEEIKQLRQLVMTQSRFIPSDFAAPFDEVFSYLLEQEVEQSLAEQMVKDMESDVLTLALAETDVASYIVQWIQKNLEQSVKTTTSLDKQIVQFVGPTGVGKTTTIAKVAANAMLDHKKSVAFITTDTYRIAAIEQLKTYAKILDIPLEVAYSKADYTHALEKFSSYDHIFVDTAGRNYRENNYVDDVEEMITFHSPNHETYLVLSLTAKSKDNLDIFRIFHEKGIDQVIFTKLDETTTYGSFINICYGEEAKIAYISDGQNVPDDVMTANATYIAKLLMRRYIYE